MSLAHLHLLLNHLPIIGTAVALGLFIVSFPAKSDEVKQAGLVILAAVALLALPAFFSGVGAQGAISKDPAVSSALIEKHEGAAILALLFMEITGGLALVALWQRHHTSTSLAVLIFATVTAGLMARVGNTGGDIVTSNGRILRAEFEETAELPPDWPR